MLHHVLTGQKGALPILFLHGFMGRGEDWGEVIGLLQNEFRCITIDLPGHGRSCALSNDEHYTMAGAAAGIIAVLETLGIERCNLVGYSMGGRIALYFALHYPERCRRLVLESATPGLKQAADRQARRAADEARAVRLETQDLGTFVEDWYTQPVFASLSRWPRLLARMKDLRQQNESAELARSLRGMGTGVQESLWDRLDALNIPTLFVAGALDGKYVEVGERMDAMSDHVRSAVVPNAGHTVHAEYPVQYADLLRDFLQAPQP